MEFALLSMGFENYTHIVVETRINRRLYSIGGSMYLDTIFKRYGEREIVRSCICRDGVLSIEVEPTEEDLKLFGIKEKLHDIHASAQTVRDVQNAQQ